MKVKVKSLSPVRLFATPWTVAHQAPPSMEFSRQEYWNRLPFPSPEDLPNPGIEPGSPTLQADALPSEPPRNQNAAQRDNKKESEKVAQSWPTLWDPMNYTVHGIFQARILEWVAIPFSRGSSQSRDRTQVSRTADRRFTL